MSQHRVAVSVGDRAAARLSRDRPWAKSQPTFAANRSRPVLHSQDPTSSTKLQSTSTANRSRPVLYSRRPALSTQPLSTSAANRNRPVLHSHTPASSTQPQPTSAANRSRPVLHSPPQTSVQSQPTLSVEIAQLQAVRGKVQALCERLAAEKKVNDARLAAVDQPFSAVMSDVRRVQARLAAYQARKAERSPAPEVRRQQGK